MASGKVLSPDCRALRPEGDLEEQGGGEQHAEERGHGDHEHQAGRAEEPVAVEAELQQGLGGAQLHHDEHSQQEPAPTTRLATISGLPQPRSGPSLTPNMTEAKPMPDSRKPGRSNRPRMRLAVLVRGRSSRR